MRMEILEGSLAILWAPWRSFDIHGDMEVHPWRLSAIPVMASVKDPGKERTGTDEENHRKITGKITIIILAFFGQTI